MSERKLATIRRIAEIKSIEGADRIVSYRVDGWWVTDTIGKYNVGDLVVYCEPDSWVPTEIAPFLTRPGHEPKEFEGIKGERLRTIKLKGVLSQGLLLPVKGDGPSGVAFYIEKIGPFQSDSGRLRYVIEGDDVTEDLKIKKYEKPLHHSLTGLARGNFPSFIPKTDQERIQNLTRSLEKWKTQNLTFEITEKIDGSSMTVYFKDGEVGVCSRNLDLKEDANNAFWEAAIRCDLISKLKLYGRNIAIQGELYGGAIQGNQYKVNPTQFALFHVWDIDNQRSFSPAERRKFAAEYMILHVPVINTSAEIWNEFNIAHLLAAAEGKSQVGDKQSEREGLVFVCNEDPTIHWKAISNKWLLKNE